LPELILELSVSILRSTNPKNGRWVRKIDIFPTDAAVLNYCVVLNYAFQLLLRQNQYANLHDCGILRRIFSFTGDIYAAFMPSCGQYLRSLILGLRHLLGNCQFLASPAPVLGVFRPQNGHREL